MAIQTVAETSAYLSSAKAEGMTEAEQVLVVDTLAATPDAGELIVGSAGCRKVRIRVDTPSWAAVHLATSSGWCNLCS